MAKKKRKRRGKGCGRFLLLAILLLAIYITALFLPVFDITDISVSGNTVLKSETVIKECTLAKGQNQSQNAADSEAIKWETVTEPFTNGLDIVGYNYKEYLYENDHEMFPERVILGSENFPQVIGYRWPMVERLPYVIGDFTWTAWDYLGEAGIGKAVYVDADDPLVEKGS